MTRGASRLGFERFAKLVAAAVCLDSRSGSLSTQTPSNSLLHQEYCPPPQPHSNQLDLAGP